MPIYKKASYISITVFIFSIFIFLAINITSNLAFNDNSKSNLKVISALVEKRVRELFLEKNYRFTTSFNPSNKSYFTFPTDYKKSYNKFIDNYENLYKNAYTNIVFIQKEYQKKSNLPVFFDQNSNFLFVPVSYIHYNDNSDLINQLDNIFNSNNIEINFDPTNIKDLKLLNYIFLESKTHQSLLLISSSLDSDPLYPGNKRSFIIINKGTGKSEKKFYVKSFIIQNLESLNQT